MPAHPTTIGPGWALLVLAAYPLVVALMRRRGEVPRGRLAAVSAAFLYAVGVIAVTVFPIMVRSTYDPWWSVIRWVPFEVPVLSFILNVVMFVPFGVLVPLLWPPAGSVRRLAAWALCASAGIELTQFVLWLTLGSRRTVDVNDLIANTAGALLGLLVLRMAARRRRYEDVQARM
jgi:glycopeptide antibiotics resistance protein